MPEKGVMKSLDEAEDVDDMGPAVPLATYPCDCVDNSGTHAVTVYKGRKGQDDLGKGIKARCHLEDDQPCGRHPEFVDKYKKEAA